MHSLSIIIIGDEILIGQVTDTNSGAIARTFGPEGWEIASVTTIADDRDAIRLAVTRALEQSDLVITTGGLGPTKDDITKHTLAEIFGGEMRRDADVLENIRQVFNRRGLKLNPLTEDQALVPTSCQVIQNRFGTAPIMLFRRGGKALISMPGVPFETEGSLPAVAAVVKSIFAPDTEILHHTLIVTGITESDLSSKLDTFEQSLAQGLHLAYLPASPIIRLRLDGHNTPQATFNAAVAQLKDELGSLLIYDGDATPAEIVVERLRQQGRTMACAESCTGGNIAHSITAIAGCSDVFMGGVVSYSNSVKINVLGVNTDDLNTNGAVSRQVVEQMAVGACRVIGTNCAVATSGIAGPGGGTPDKPVGTVWMAACVDGQVKSKIVKLPGNRARVIARATDEALLLLIQMI
jgi:nicotinamide-nucleotide amidase